MVKSSESIKMDLYPLTIHERTHTSDHTDIEILKDLHDNPEQISYEALSTDQALLPTVVEMRSTSSSHEQTMDGQIFAEKTHRNEWLHLCG